MREIRDWFGRSSGAEGADVLVIGCPFDGAASGRRGAAAGPAAIREWARTAEAIDEHGRAVGTLAVHDTGDVVAADGRAARAAIEDAAARGWRHRPDAFQLALGGDHAVTPPLFAAARRRHPNLRLLLLDAHADCFDSYDGDRWSHACAVARCQDPGGLAPQHTALVGLRSFAEPERAAIEGAGLVVTSAAWLAADAETIAARVAATLGGGPVYLSLDIDVLDPASAPGTGYPVAGGPTSRELLDLLAAVWARLEVVALDLVEVSPPLDPAGITAATAAHLLLQVLAHVADGSRRQPG